MRIFSFVLAGMIALSAGALETQAKAKEVNRTKPIRHCLGTYDNEPRLPNGHVDTQKLLSDLKELHANTYHWLIWHGTNDWEDLKGFLPLARKKHINVWVTLVPPSESPPRTKNFSEPFRLDYEKWAVELGKLSAKEKNLVAWSIDDFSANLKFFTPEKLRNILDAAHQFNPKLAFVPCCYFRQIKPEFAGKYTGLLDGILFPYRGESSGKANLTDASLVQAEIAQLKSQFGESFPVVLDIYATAHATIGASTPEYVRDVIVNGARSADGILIYCHQDKQKQAAKFKVVEEQFRHVKWGK